MKNIVLAIAILFMQSCATNFMDTLNQPKLSKNNLVMTILHQQTN